MFASRRDTADDVRERFIRVVGLPEIEDVAPGAVGSVARDRSPAGGDTGVLDASPVGSVAWDRSPAGGDTGVLDPSPAGSVGPPGAGLPDAAFPAAGGLRGVFGALDPGRRGVRALAAVAVVAVAVAGFLAWRSRPQVEPVAARTEPAAAPAAPGNTPTGTPGVLVVAVTGRVQHPGLIRLPAGARVADAIEAAGGALPGTDLSFVNLARKLVDGELVAVGVTPPPGVAVGPAGGDGAGAPDGTAAGPLNINTATAAQFETLPGIGPVLAQHIVDYRTRHGPFRSVDELRQVDGLGTARFSQIKPLVTV
jgi:competence protein ComEA